MGPYAAAGWQLAAGRAQLQHRWRCRVRGGLLLATCSVLLVLAGASDQQKSGGLGSGTCDCTTRTPTPTARPRTHCTTGPGRIDWQAAHDCHRAQSTHKRIEPRSSSSGQHLARSRWCSIFLGIHFAICYLVFVICCCIPKSYHNRILFPVQNGNDQLEIIVMGSRKQFQTRFCFDLVNSLWFSTQSNRVFRKHQIHANRIGKLS